MSKTLDMFIHREWARHIIEMSTAVDVYHGARLRYLKLFIT
jgi:hypothetical protein